MQNKVEEDEYWEEILQTINVEFLPVEYIQLIVVTFDDGEIWEIDVADTQGQTKEEIDDTLREFFDEYEDKIVNMDFRLNIQKLKRDIGKRTKRFLKLNK